MYYTIYKITNLINSKIYIGKHQTKNLDDNYMGSGKHLTLSKKKYGLENFKKEILFIFDNEESMNSKEAELVTEDFCNRDDTYNICPGGKGGFGYINSNNLQYGSPSWLIAREKNFIKAKAKQKELLKSSKYALERVKPMIQANIGNKYWYGRSHSKETKNKMSVAASKRTGSKNSQFGTCWIVNKDGPIKIKKEDLDKYLELGYIRGRKWL